jgi:hypothetical protein
MIIIPEQEMDWTNIQYKEAFVIRDINTKKEA